ncbi:MAG TPA: EAL domain-containing protein [Saccharospirillum sp.]|nr:EAL domain-containing protein [Saccharospirillum sp.]
MSIDTGKRRLLVLEDDPLTGRTIQTIAEFSGLAVMFTTEPDDFFRLVDEWPPDVIAIDLIMPAMDGVQVLAQLGERGCKARVIITSGVDSRVLDAARRAAEQHGLTIAGILAKPFSPAELRALLMQPVNAAGQPPQPSGDGQEGPTVEELQHAINHNGLSLAYQPQVNCQSGTLRGFEALVRWEHPRLGWVGPDRFIPMSESLGLIDSLTEWVVNAGLEWFAGFRGRHLGPAVNDVSVHLPEHVQLSLNVSVLTLTNFELFERLYQRCIELGLKAEWITFEVTESSAMDDPMVTLETLTRLRMRGFKLSIDDFGTGFSSMVQLVRLPFTELKIDRSFVFSSSHSEESRQVIRSIVELGNSLGMQTVAEGVETEAALAYLKSLGCDLAQGYYFARPLFPDDLEAWLTSYGRDDEEHRLASLHSLHLLDTPAERRFDRITALAQRLFDMPIALITLIDRERQWFKSNVGVPGSGTPRNESFCTHAIQDNRIMVVEDATRDTRVWNLKSVTGPDHIRFYAGYPLQAPDGSRLGTLCILDTQPHALEDHQLGILQTLGQMVEMEMASDADTALDPVTGVFTRPAFEYRAHPFLELARRLNTGVALLLFKLQGFNTTPDQQAMTEAEQGVLARFAELLGQTFRHSDLVGRYGDDEFALLVLESEDYRLDRLSERLNTAVDRIEAEVDQPLKLDVCMGQAVMLPGDIADLQSLMATADQEVMTACAPDQASHQK